MQGYDEGESVYNLVRPEVPPPPKQPLFRSSVPANVPPTSSTFGISQTTAPGVANMGGYSADTVPHGPYRHKKPAATFGREVRGDVEPSHFLRRGDGEKLTATIQREKQDKDRAKNKPEVPSAGECSKLKSGIVTKKNFVVANAVEVILAEPKRPVKTEPDYLRKSDFGKTPAYLEKIRADINGEYEYLRQLREDEEAASAGQRREMPEEERQALIAALKAKWEAVNREYQQQTHMVISSDDLGKVRRKERAEKELAQLEKDLTRLSRPNIVVDATM